MWMEGSVVYPIYELDQSMTLPWTVYVVELVLPFEEDKYQDRAYQLLGA